MTIDKFSTRRNSFSRNRCFLFSLAAFFLMSAVFCPQRAAVQSDDKENWIGTYTFEDAAQTSKKRNFTDTVPATSYDIVIEAAADGKFSATVSENGVQVYQAYQCSVKTSGDKIEFYYEKFVADGAADLRKFKRGELLFSLVKTQIGKQTKYLFQPAAYKITRYDKAKQKQPIYFQKQ